MGWVRDLTGASCTGKFERDHPGDNDETNDGDSARGAGNRHIRGSAFAQAQVKYVNTRRATAPRGACSRTTHHPRDSRGAVGGRKPTGRTMKLADVKLMAPAEAKKVIAAGLNYKSHIGQASPAKYVGLFAKFPTSLSGHDADIPYPADATEVHYEAEICVVMGKKAQNITEAQVKDHIFGVTACNDVSERAWQKQDLQWFRAKAHDTSVQWARSSSPTSTTTTSS